jgi:hypothetical protein
METFGKVRSGPHLEEMGGYSRHVCIVCNKVNLLRCLSWKTETEMERIILLDERTKNGEPLVVVVVFIVVVIIVVAAAATAADVVQDRRF